jgi:hypothetical protein
MKSLERILYLIEPQSGCDEERQGNSTGCSKNVCVSHGSVGVYPDALSVWIA